MLTSGKNSQDAASYIRGLLSRGRFTFTLKEAMHSLKVSKIATRAALRRLKDKGFLATPARGFYVIVPPEYEALGCLPAEQFISDLMHFFEEPYYIGLLSAAELHGAAHQKPQEFQVIVPRNRKMITSGKVTIRFIARKSLKVPTVPIKTPRGFIQVSTPEATVFDLLLYPDYSGGLNNIATVLNELSEKINPNSLRAAAANAPNISSIQRTGYIFDRILRKKTFSKLLERMVKKKAKAIIPLTASGTRKGVKIDPKWNVFVNEKIEPDV